jgi:glycerophosphoryl diester phosphodiesterase
MSTSTHRSVAELLDVRRPVVIAHRGLSGLFPENTLLAFERALDAGAEMLELDVTLSRDGVPFVLHDAELDRTTDGSGLAALHTAAQLRALDAGGWFSPEHRGQRLPELAEVLTLARGRAAVNVEIKAEAVTERIAGGVVEKAIAAVHAAGMADAVLLSSFAPRALHQAREVDPALWRGTLFDPAVHRDRPPAAILAETGSRSFHLARDEVTPYLVEECHAHGAAVLVYTVNDPREMQALFGLGVDGVFTDRVDLGLELVRQR